MGHDAGRRSEYRLLHPEDALALIFEAGFKGDDPEWIVSFERLCLQPGGERISPRSFVHFLMEDLRRRCEHTSVVLQDTAGNESLESANSLIEDFNQRCQSASGCMQDMLRLTQQQLTDKDVESTNSVSFVRLLMDDLAQSSKHTGVRLRDMVEMSDDPAQSIGRASFAKLLMETLARRIQHTSDSLEDMLRVSEGSVSSSKSLCVSDALSCSVSSEETLAARGKSRVIMHDTTDSQLLDCAASQLDTAPKEPYSCTQSKCQHARAKAASAAMYGYRGLNVHRDQLRLHSNSAACVDNIDMASDDGFGDSSRCSTSAPSTPRAGTSCSDYESLGGSRPSSVRGSTASSHSIAKGFTSVTFEQESLAEQLTQSVSPGEVQNPQATCPASSRNNLPTNSLEASPPCTHSKLLESQPLPDFLGRRKQLNRGRRDFFKWNFRRSSRAQQRYETIESAEEDEA